MPHKSGFWIATLGLLATSGAHADFTNNIMLTGYWPPTNEMIRHFSTNPDQNPDGWTGENWEQRGYDVYSFFPEFPDGLGQGIGDFEVDYQDTSADFWRIVDEIRPVALVAFGRGLDNRTWEVEWQYRNLERYDWQRDYTPPRRPSPSPPDSTVPPGFVRYSTLPMDEIVEAVNDEDEIDVAAFVDDTGFAGAFLCEYIGYHTAWYHDLHAEPSDPDWNVTAGQIHVGGRVSVEEATIASEITLREVIDFVDAHVPEPGTVVLLITACLARVGWRRG